MINKALFLDRDGIINIDSGYVGTVERLELIPGTIELCKKAQENNFKLVVITNQAGIAKEKFTFKNFLTLTAYIDTLYRNNGIHLIHYFCPYHIDAVKSEYLINTKLQKEIIPFTKPIKVKENIFLSDYRKPHPGMIIQAANQFNINLKKSIFIGDNIIDMQAAKSAGINKRIIISEKTMPLATQNIPFISCNLIAFE